jgi:hypothetical protein
MAQVCQQWRQVLHSNPQLWNTLYLKIHPCARAESAATVVRENGLRMDGGKRFNNQIKFYEYRLPTSRPGLPIQYHLEHLSFHAAGSTHTWMEPEISQPPDVSRLYNMCISEHRFTIKLKSISLSNFSYKDAAHILSNWFSASNRETLTALRITKPKRVDPGRKPILVSRFPLAKLRFLEEPVDAKDDATWPETNMED